MSQATISVKIDEKLKKEFSSICDELGLSMSSVIVVLAKKMIREKRLPFEVSIDPFFSDKNMFALKESIEQMKQGKTVVKTLEELEKLEKGDNV